MSDFYFFRYQLSPDRLCFNNGLKFDETYIETLGELTEKKNEVFRYVLDSMVSITSDREDAEKRKFQAKDATAGEGLLAYRIAVFQKKLLEIDWRRGRMINEPSFLVVVDNDPDTQILVLEKNPQAYSNIKDAMKKVEGIFQKLLAPYFLRISIAPVYDQSEFWSLLREKEAPVKSLKFNLFAPNMPGLSRNLSDWVKESMENTNASESQLTYNAAGNSCLNVEEADRDIRGLVNYAADGAGSVQVKFRGNRSYEKVGESIVKIEISEEDVTILTHDDIAIAVKR